jgi:hypothetical protein
MGCLVAVLALISPRLAIVALWLFTTLLGRAYEEAWIPILGFLLLPWTTLAYAAMWGLGTNGVTGFEWFLVGFAFLADIGAVGGSSRGRR